MADKSGPAFPMAFNADDSGTTGMTLREYMVIQFMAAHIVARGMEVGDPKSMVENSLYLADLVMKRKDR